MPILGYVNPDPTAQDKFSTCPTVGWIEVTNDPAEHPSSIEAKLIAKLIDEIETTDHVDLHELLTNHLKSRVIWDGSIQDRDITYTHNAHRGFAMTHVFEGCVATHKPTGLTASSNDPHKSKMSNKTIAREKLLRKLQAWNQQ